MDVDVLAVAPDGALVVRISEWVDGDPRARQAYTCTVYGIRGCSVRRCRLPSQAEWVCSRTSGVSSWMRLHGTRSTIGSGAKETPQYSLVEDFTMGDDSDAKKMVINEDKKMKLHNGGVGTRRKRS